MIKAEYGVEAWGGRVVLKRYSFWSSATSIAAWLRHCCRAWHGATFSRQLGVTRLQPRCLVLWSALQLCNPPLAYMAIETHARTLQLWHDGGRRRERACMA